MTFSRLAGSIFALVAAVHAWRLVDAFPLRIGSFEAPQSASWIGLLVAGTLAFLGLRARG